jgi:hypothetical protein
MDGGTEILKHLPENSEAGSKVVSSLGTQFTVCTSRLVPSSLSCKFGVVTVNAQPENPGFE